MGDGFLLLGGELLLAGPADDVLGVGAGLAAAVDRGDDDAVAAVVEQGERPGEVAAHVAEGVVAHHGEVAQRVAGLALERGDLLPQPADVLGEGVGTAPARRAGSGAGRPPPARGRGRRGPGQRRRARSRSARVRPYDRGPGGRRRREGGMGKWRVSAPDPPPHRLPGRAGQQLPPGLPAPPPRPRRDRLRVLRGRLRGGRGRRRRPGDDPDRQLAGRPGRRHPPLPADVVAAHRRRALPAHPVLADGAPGRDRRHDPYRPQPRPRARPVPQGDPRARPDAGRLRRHRRRGPRDRRARRPHPGRDRAAARRGDLRARRPARGRRGRGPQHDPLRGAGPRLRRGRRPTTARSSRRSSSTSATSRPPSTRRSAASRPTAST